jgi:hypothetical protein
MTVRVLGIFVSFKLLIGKRNKSERERERPHVLIKIVQKIKAYEVN